MRLHCHHGETTENAACDRGERQFWVFFQTLDIVVLLVLNTYEALTRSDMPGQERLHRLALLSTTRQECFRLLCRSYKGSATDSRMTTVYYRPQMLVLPRLRPSFPHAITDGDSLIYEIYIKVAGLSILNSLENKPVMMQFV